MGHALYSKYYIFEDKTDHDLDLNLDVLANLDLDLVLNWILYHVSRLKNIFNFNKLNKMWKDKQTYRQEFKIEGAPYW